MDKKTLLDFLWKDYRDAFEGYYKCSDNQCRSACSAKMKLLERIMAMICMDKIKGDNE